MLAQGVVDEIRNLLAIGLSYRRIARVTGVCRNTIGAIATGKRVERPPREEQTVLRPVGPPRRCRTCGGLVYMPCQLCSVRAAVAKQPREARREAATRESPEMNVALEGEQRQRYEQVRRQHFGFS